MAICALCQKETELRDSHIYPDFAVQWKLKTSSTGFMRSGDEVNIPRQGGLRRKLLCHDCEQLLSKVEKYFAENFFRRYINECMDDDMVDKGRYTFDYDERLLKFVLSVQWRLLLEQLNMQPTPYDLSEVLVLENAEEVMRDYLVGNRNDTDGCSSYLIFLHNIVGGQGCLPDDFPDNAMQYVLRALDGTVIRMNHHLHMYSKIGPFAFLTALKPKSIVGISDAKIHKNGKIDTGQKITNGDIATYIYMYRPQAMKHVLNNLSERQKAKIDERLSKNPERVESSLQYKAMISDIDVQNYLETQKEYDDI